MTEKLKLAAIFAHPDDEAFGTGGTLTKYAHEGVEVHLIMATRGEAGQIANPSVPFTRPISTLRERELRCACQYYGLDNLHLLGYVDGQTAVVPPSEAVFKIVKLLRQIKPQVVLSFGPEGIYGHFDHLVVHRWATAAVELAADDDCWPEAGPPHQTEKFYYRAMAQSQIEQMKLLNESGQAVVDMGGVPFPFIGYPPEKITTVVDVRDYAQTKLNAIRCHISQINPEMPLLQEAFNPAENEWFWQETFILAQINGQPVDRTGQKETDLFAEAQ